MTVVLKKISLVINCKKLIFLLVFFFLFSNQSAYSQRTTLKKITLHGDSLAIFLFDGNIILSSELDSTKTLITLDFSNSLLDNSVNNFQNVGNIKQINSKTKKNNVVVQIQTTEPTGYTTYFDAITKQLYVNLFNWKDLNEAEDLFHTSLLALEEGLDSIAFSYLSHSLQKGFLKASILIAVQEFKKGKINRAFKYSEIGEYHTGEYPQVLLIRSAIFNSRGDSATARVIENKYKKIAGGDIIPLKIPKLRIEGDTLSIAEIRLIDSLCQTLMQLQKDTTESEFKRFNALFDTTNNKNQEKQLVQSFYDNIPLWLQLLIGAAFASIILLLYFYFRWRTLQVKAKMSKTRQKAIEKMQSEKIKDKTTKPKVPQSKVAQKYAQQSQDLSDAKPSIQENIEPITPDKANKIEAALLSIKEEKLKEQQEIIQERQSSRPRSNAKIELATNLMNEQKRIKQQKIKDLPSELIDKSEKIKKIANELGLEENSLEIKKTVDNILKDQSKLDKLSGKL